MPSQAIAKGLQPRGDLTTTMLIRSNRMADAIILLRPCAHNPEPCAKLTPGQGGAIVPLQRALRCPDGLTGFPRP